MTRHFNAIFAFITVLFMLLMASAILGPLLAILATAAFAQDGAVALDDVLAPIRPYLSEIISVMAIAMASWLASWLRSIFKISLDEKHRAALHSALENGGRLILNGLDAAAKGKTVNVGNPIVETGVEYVLKYSPDAVAHFGLTPVRVAELLRAKIAPAKG